jgi:hypothetical protein
MGKGCNEGEGAARLSKSSAKKSAVKNGAKGMSDMAGKAARYRASAAGAAEIPWSEGMRYEPHSYFMARRLGSRLERSA